MKFTRIFFVTAVIACVSCISNPLDYPYVPADITAFEVEGQKSVSIDNVNRVVNIVLKETADMDSIVVKKYEYSSDAIALSELPSMLDLTVPVKVSYKTHPDQIYEWTIVATQPIERYVKCGNMIGEAEFNLSTKEIIAYFPEDQKLSEIRFTKMKLEAQGSKVDSTFGYISQNGVDVATKEKLQFPITLDCVISRRFKVLYRHEVMDWTFTAIHKIINLEITSVDAWCYHADIAAVFKGNGLPVIEYREASGDEWIPLETKVEGVNISATVDQLTEGTSYVARVVNGEELSEEYPFTTEEPEQLQNMSFDHWYQGDPNGYTWYPMPDASSKLWTSANAGVNMMSAVNSTRPDYTFRAVPKGAAAKLESVDAFSKFAAGNILTGEFLKAVVTPAPGAELTWGVPFTNRPYSLKGYYAYSPKKIDYASGKHANKLGEMDKCQIVAMLTDWEEPFLIQTATATFVDYDNDPGIIALGIIESDVDTQGEYVEFECVLQYRNARKPKYVVLVACSSLYGDYFTGGKGSMMHVDEWEFIYK